MADFFHKQLISAAGRDAFSNAAIGAGIGAVAGVGTGIISDDTSVMGGAVAGAIMGAGAGAGMRAAGSKYTANYMKAIEADPNKIGSGLDVTMFSKPEKGFNFVKNTDEEQAAYEAAYKNMMNDGAKGTKTDLPKGGEVKPESKVVSVLPKGTDLRQHQADKMAKREAWSPGAIKEKEIQDELAKNKSTAHQKYFDKKATERMQEAEERARKRALVNLQTTNNEAKAKQPYQATMADLLTQLKNKAETNINSSYTGRRPNQKGRTSNAAKEEANQLRELAKSTDPISNYL